MAPTKSPSGAGSGPEFFENEPRSALDAAIDAARLTNPVIEGPNGQRHVFVPAGYRIEDVRDPFAVSPHILQAISVDDAESLIGYANRFRDERSIIVADIDALKVRAALDWHKPEADEDSPLAPQPCRHNATLVLRGSEEFKRWSEMEDEFHDQMVFAEFLDENASDIVDPEPSVMIEIARDLEATQGVTFKASTRLQTGERNLSYETETHVKGELRVPTQFTLSIPIFEGEEPIDITASFRFRPRPDGLKLGFVWRRVEYRRQAEFRAIAFRVAERTGLPVIFGRAG